MTQVQVLGPATRDPQVAAGIHENIFYPSALQRVYRAVDRVAFGDAAKVQAHRAPKAHAAVANQVHIPPGTAARAQPIRSWRAWRQVSPFLEPVPHAGIKGAVTERRK